MELKRRLNDISINEDREGQGFTFDDIHVMFDRGRILFVRDGRIVSECGVAEFLRSPSSCLRALMQSSRPRQ